MKRTMWNVMIKEVTVDIQIILILTVWDFRRMKINTLLGDPMEIVRGTRTRTRTVLARKRTLDWWHRRQQQSRLVTYSCSVWSLPCRPTTRRCICPCSSWLFSSPPVTCRHPGRTPPFLWPSAVRWYPGLSHFHLVQDKQKQTVKKSSNWTKDRERLEIYYFF